MGYQTITPISLVDFIDQLELAMLAEGWTDTGLTGSLGSSSGKILVSAADSLGRKAYVELFEDAAGNIAVHIAPELNDGGTDLHSFLDHFIAFNFTVATWKGFIYDDMVYIGTGVAQADYHVWFGMYYALPTSTVALLPWTCFCTGTEVYDTGAASGCTFMFRGLYLSKFYRTNNFVPPWGSSHPMLLSKQSSNGAFASPPNDWKWYDDALVATRVLLCGYSLISTAAPDLAGITGYMPHTIMVAKNPLLADGDRVTLDSGVTYFRMVDPTNYWNKYLNNQLVFEE